MGFKEYIHQHKKMVITIAILFIIQFIFVIFLINRKAPAPSLSRIESQVTGLVDGQDKIINNLVDIHLELKTLAKSDSIMNEQLRSYPAAVPTTGNISSFYQIRKDPINGQPTFHTGVDIRAPKGTAVLATGDGIIDKAIENYDNYGKTIVINHLNGYQSLYGHLSMIEVNRNQLVKRGQEIGKVGSTGRSTGNHLHYEISFKQKKISPGVFRIPYRTTSFLQSEYNIYHLL